ncbi:hypothetical protein HD554DRAFT_2146238, partial [Boletus coccyginus]
MAIGKSMSRGRKPDVGGDRHRAGRSSECQHILMHLPNFGDHQVTKVRPSIPVGRHAFILARSCPLSQRPGSEPHKVVAMEIGPRVLSERAGYPSLGNSMISTTVPDDMANEQTWLVEQKMADAATREEGMEDERASVRAARRAPVARDAGRRRTE